MTPNQFRKLALALPGATQGAHMGHADFRVGGKIFATLGYPDKDFGVVLLKPDQQALLTQTASAMFSPVPGGWGLKGSTRVHLKAADAASVTHALKMAWELRAPKLKPDPRAMARAFARVVKAAKATKLDGVTQSTSYGTPALKVAGKFLMRMKDAGTFVFACGADEKALLMEAEPSIYFETGHYNGYPLVLVHAATVSDAELGVCITRAWRLQAAPRLQQNAVTTRKTAATTRASSRRSTPAGKPARAPSRRAR